MTPVMHNELKSQYIALREHIIRCHMIDEYTAKILCLNVDKHGFGIIAEVHFLHDPDYFADYRYISYIPVYVIAENSDIAMRIESAMIYNDFDEFEAERKKLNGRLITTSAFNQ